MLCDLLDGNPPNFTLSSNNVDRTVRSTQPDRLLALPLTPERLVVVPGDLTRLPQAAGFDIVYPGGQILYDVAR
jgi:hypothetical protein